MPWGRKKKRKKKKRKKNKKELCVCVCLWEGNVDPSLLEIVSGSSPGCWTFKEKNNNS
jgi:hypothetical protein